MRQDLKKSLSRNIAQHNKLQLLKKKYLKSLLIQLSFQINFQSLKLFSSFPKGLIESINFGNNVKTEIIANNIAIPVKTPK